MTLQPPRLFERKREWAIFLLACIFVAALQLLFYYQSYQNFIQNDKLITKARVLAQYPKNDYVVLKLQNDDFTFYTTSRKKLEDLQGDDVTILLFLNNITIGFKDYLTHFYAPSHIIKSTPTTQKLQPLIVNQHDNLLWQEFYAAIFLAKPLSKELRDIVAAYGISHLVALSGFHIAIISAMLYFVLRPPYRLLHTRYFPYRYELIDLGFVVAVVLGYYLYLTDFPPSLVRSYGMFLAGWILVLLGLNILSYAFLFFVCTLLVAIDVRLVFSLGFYFSVAGVFYIYLFLDVFARKSKLFVMLGITLWTFAAMNPLIHYFFHVTAYEQLLSPLLTLLFSLFYPLSLFLHTIGYGSLLDFTLPTSRFTWDFATPAWFYYAYIALSLAAIKDFFKPLLVASALGFNLILFLL
jgi:competence protein ComEC